MVYSLRYDKKEFCLEIAPFKTLNPVRINGIKYHNEGMYLSSDRKLLRTKAKEIKNEWIEDLEYKLQKAKDIKVKNKY